MRNWVVIHLSDGGIFKFPFKRLLRVGRKWMGGTEHDGRHVHVFNVDHVVRYHVYKDK